MEDTHETAREVGRVLLDALGEDLVAVYLHGSAVLGGFRWEEATLTSSRSAARRCPISSSVAGWALSPH